MSMTVFGKTSHALFFNGITDSVVCPQGSFTQTGHKINVDGTDARTSAQVVQDGSSYRHALFKQQSLSSFTIEAWVSPDCGGIVAIKEGVFELRIGSVGAPAPASFSVTLDNDVTHTASSKHNYPTNAESFISTHATSINTSQRELYHICGVFTGEHIRLYVNGQTMASEKLNSRYRVNMNDQDLYLGGKGGEYRGYIESIHWQRGEKAMDIAPTTFNKTSSTLGLWRFEEPVDIDDNTFYIKSNVTAGDTTITLDATQAQTLYRLMSGKSDSFSGTYTPESLGNYRVLNAQHSGGKQVISVAHRQYNLLINPTGTDLETGLPNGKAPERVRIVSVTDAGVVTVESIHLDFIVSTDTGLRGVLHARTAYNSSNILANDSAAVLIRSDLLIDTQTGKPYHLTGSATQAIDRNGSMIIDESGYDFHGFIYSRQCSVADSSNPFTVSAWTIDTELQKGHGGRHKYNHLEGHSFLRLLPTSSQENIQRTIDGVADSMSAVFPAAHIGIKEQLPINSKIAMAYTAFNGPIRKTITSATTTDVVKNGMFSIDASQDGVIAIGVNDIRPFLLKGYGHENVETNDDTHKMHLIPEDESRVAIMQVSGLTVPYVEIHYNAIDLTGAKMGVSNPCLLVTKTVPSANSFIDGQRVATHIANAVGATLHSAGGIVVIANKSVGEAHNVLQSHRLVGDNTGGTEKETELDETRLPTTYTPLTSTDRPRAPPLAITSSLEHPTHPSSYHHLILRPIEKSQSDPPIGEPPSHYQEQEQFVSQQGTVYEMFDVIDNYKANDEHHIIVQPSQKRRSMQLARVVGEADDKNDHVFASLEYVQGQGRISSFQIKEVKGNREIIMRARGLMADVADQTTSYTGDGSPDSHAVKEIMPGAPVVTVSLGGAGQGAINTKPSWDTSSLSRVGWNTRRDCGAKVKLVTSGTFPFAKTATIEVTPLNNESANLASWGTYCFPATGKIYLPNGAFAHYVSKTATTFTFDLAANQYSLQYGREGSFTNSNGTSADSFQSWLTVNGVDVGTTILLDPEFDTQSVCSDGTTVNDRLFQSIGSVSHDYQLGTQYASTRALVEIPLFPNQFFENREAGIFPGPDNSMKLHLDATMTAHTWSPSPVGRRAPNKSAIDHEAFGPYYQRWYNDDPIRVTVKNIRAITTSGTTSYMVALDNIDRVPQSSLTASGSVRGMSNQNWLRKVYLQSGEWCYYVINDASPRADTSNKSIELLSFATHHSENFFEELQEGSVLTIGQMPFKVFKPLSSDNSENTVTSANEYRSPFYYDRANVQTQGGNIDYGLRQYVSAVEFKAGPLANPHLPRIETGVTRIRVLELTSVASPQVLRFENISGVLPKGTLPTNYDRFSIINVTTGDEGTMVYNAASDENQVTVYFTSTAPVVGDIIEVRAIVSSTSTQYPLQVADGCVNATWNYPFCPGGLRYGDTIWMNMHYTNPHAIEGLFAKSRGVLNEYEVWTGFNGGKGSLGIQARDSLPLENFLIGNTCIETARNFVQHVNKTIEMNWSDLGHTSNPPVVAYLDPYLSTEQHARVLLYDVAHDREFIAFHDLQMQVQSSATTPVINELDVAAGFATQRKDISPNRAHASATYGATTYTDLETSSGHSQFVEAAYSHASWYLMDYGYQSASTGQFSRASRQSSHYVKTASLSSTEHDRIEPSVIDDDAALTRHRKNIAGTSTYIFNSRFFDTPDGTRVIPAFLCMKGKRSSDLTINSNNESARLQNLPQWYAMDFTRRLTIDFGSVGMSIGDTEIETAAHEVVRLINQAGAVNGKSSQRRPSDQYPGEGERFDINRRAVTASGEDTFEPSDPTSAHHHADFATTGSTHDPAPFWDDSAFTSYDRGSHMGYMRAHIGRVVEDIEGNPGYSIIIHSTVPGASGRNFCVWLDNSKGQTEYKPQYLIGHGGHFRNFYCAQPEMVGENMHPAPMPIDKNGKPFAPITTLRQYIPIDEAHDDVENSQNLGFDSNLNTNTTDSTLVPTTPNTESTTGRGSNTINMESFEDDGQKFTVREGLQQGTTASARINFGGMVASGIPGFSPAAGKWGFGENAKEDKNRFLKIYKDNMPSTNTRYATYSPYVPTNEVDREQLGVGTNLYGLKLTDHLGRNHIIRYVYSQEGVDFTNQNTVLPSTVDEEIFIHFDDRDVSKGGFTLGDRMWGIGASGTPVEFRQGSSTYAWRGNEFRGVYAPNVGYSVTVSPDTTLKSGAIVGTSHTISAGGTGYSNGTYDLLSQPRVGGAQGSNGQITVTVTAGVVTAITALANAGTGYAVGDVLTIDGGDNNATITIGSTTAVSGYASPASLILKEESGCGEDDTGIWHRLPDVDDVLGWMGFPDSGLLWVSLEDGAHTSSATHVGPIGVVFHYTGRTHNSKTGTHAFFGLTGQDADDMDNWFTSAALMGPTASQTTYQPVTISPYLNQTTIITDELIAAVTEAAFNFEAKDGETMNFDCSEMFAPDGRTYAEHMGNFAQTAITIKAYNPKKDIRPLSDLFRVELSEDYGILSGSVNKAESSSTVVAPGANADMGGLSSTEINNGRMLDIGYLPKTLLHITTRYRGFNANTATPVVIDSSNNPINTNNWQKHLRGETFTRHEGDHITPSFHNLPIRLNESFRGSVVYAEAASGSGFLQEEKDYPTHVLTGSGNGELRHSVRTDYRGPRLIDAISNGGEGYAVGDTYDVYDYELVVGKGAITGYTVSSPSTSNGYESEGGLSGAGSAPLPGYTITTAGTGYVSANGPFTTTHTTGDGAVLGLATSGGNITSVNSVQKKGHSYANGDVINIIGGDGTGQITVATAALNVQGALGYTLTNSNAISTGTGGTAKVIADDNGRVVSVKTPTGSSNCAVGDEYVLVGGGASDDAKITVTGVSAGQGSGYVANTDYELRLSGVKKGVVQLELDDNDNVVGIASIVEPLTHGHIIGTTFDIFDHTGAGGTGGQVQVKGYHTSTFTVKVISGGVRTPTEAYRWDVGNDFLLGPYGREKSWQLNHLDSTLASSPATTTWGNEMSWVSPTKLQLTEEHSMLVYPVGTKIRFFGADTTEHIDTDVWQRVITREYSFHLGSVTSEVTGIDDSTLRLFGQRYKTTDKSFAGIRLSGSTNGNPLVYFRGAQDSLDHSIPLYFGGGFSGLTMDINDGARVDYTEHNEHPYASGPTGCAGMQNIGENMGAYALLDTTAMMAMFPGTATLDQMRGSSVPIFANQDAILSTDMDAGANSHSIPTRTYTDVKVTKPSPIVLRFAHPYARYTDSENSVAYIVFGPGQAAPKHWHAEGVAITSSVEPSAKWTVAAHHYMTENGATQTYNIHTEHTHGLPNELSNTTLGGGANQYLPKTTTYKGTDVAPYKLFTHWDTPLGAPNTLFNQSAATHSHNITNHFGSTSTNDTAANIYAHPYSHYKATIRTSTAGITPDPAVAKTGVNKMIFQLDGGYAPGGSWFDDTVRKNPPHPTTGATVPPRQTATINSATVELGLNATMFRVGAQVATGYDQNADESNPPTDTFLIDATRCQNSEELGAVIAAAINTWPGKANLKAIGGTFLPSFQDAQRQDRYGWINLLAFSSYDATNGIVVAANTIPDTVPENGWIRVTNVASGGSDVFYGYYSHRSDSRFFLGNNYRSNQNVLEDPTVSTASGGVANGVVSSLSPSAHQIHVWSKTGNLRWDNGFQEQAISLRSTSATGTGAPTNSAYDHLGATHVHFNGVTDAIDRTRAIGAVGWHGERYSYLNSLYINDGGAKVSAGLGAWNPASGFSPYGATMNCHTINSVRYTIVAAPDDETETSNYDIVPVIDSHPAVSGTHQRHYVAISYEGDLPIIAKAAREGQATCGDMLSLKWSTSTVGGTVVSYHNERFNNDRFSAESNAGPNVEALYDSSTYRPLDPDNQKTQASASTQATLYQMDTCLFPTGDLFYNRDVNPGVKNYSTGVVTENLFDSEQAINYSQGYTNYATHLTNTLTFWKTRSAARNFFAEHVVWKRMSGGNLSLPAPNARGLGSIPWQVHKADDGNYYRLGETIYGNTRFSFETTNHAMFPIIQAQELAHPSLAEQFPYEIRNALAIPNEDIQFEKITVVDDTGQEHTLAGGSPLGIVIRDFKKLQDRATNGLAPALAGSGDEPNMKIQLPNHDGIPSNLIVRSGFDRLQAYQHETIGDGGLMHPAQPSAHVSASFDNDGKTPNTYPYWEQLGYEHIDNHPNQFPNSKSGLTDDNILKTSYEPHDRALYFHVTKMGYSYTEREPMRIINNVMTLNRLTVASIGTDTITTNEFINGDIWKQDPTPDGRYFISINGTIATFTDPDDDLDGTTKVFENVVFAPDFTATGGDSIKPSYYVPAGTTRHFAARRLRDHAEVSGNSPDKPLTDWASVSSGTSPATAVRAANKLTPMPLPRMGHHYITPTMSVMPGHLAHPAYQIISQRSHACASATRSEEMVEGYENVVAHRDTLVWFSGVTASNPPSDIHGDGFTLLTETKLRFDGYGIASDAVCNEAGGHRISLEAGTNYNTAWHFPDPMEVGAYQIVIQPNLFSHQLMGNNENTVFGSTSAPVNSSGVVQTRKPLLTDQQIATVVALQWSSDRFDLILSEATMADVRGCEIYLNELMLDFDPSTREQFTNIPILGLNNPYGINASTSGAFTRRSLPYHPNMFTRATPSRTITIPWWAVAYDQSTVFSGNPWLHTEHYHPDDYYHFSRSTLGGVGCQLTLTGYPSHYLDVYTEYLVSLTPTCTIQRLDTSSGYKIFVDNNALFPLVGTDYKKHKLSIVGTDGVTHYFDYTDRGYISNPTAGSNTTVFNLTGTPSAYSWGKLAPGQTVRLTGPYSTLLAGEVFTKSRESVATRNLPQLLSGTRDTNSSNPADAYLCLWHYNLGRPMTWFSDSRGAMGDAAADKAPYNHLPEHFETVHYHEFVYAMSDGPFKFRMRGKTTPGSAITNDWTDSNYPHQAGTDGKSRKYHFGAFWPGGHRFGAQMSSLTLYGTASIGWGAKDGTIQIDNGSGGLLKAGLQVTDTDPTTLTDSISSVNTKRRVGFGYRVSVRQPYNRPRWAIKGGQALRDPYASYHFDIDGPFVSIDGGSGYSFAEKPSGSVRNDTTANSSYTGILERHTTASALIGTDLKGQQVRYSHGRRMTKGFGCAVRNIVNPTTAFRLFHADTPAGLEGTDVVDQRVSLALAQAHYMVDWWGNTTGEEVRRFPVRGFGVRPSWDPEDAYRATDRTKSAESMVAQRSTVGQALAVIDFYDPATAKRVGDRGDGRGVRWPTVFNEDKLQDVSTNLQLSGIVLSHHTSEPPFTNGFIRPLNTDLQNYEVPYGISNRLDISADDGLLKPAAMIGENMASVETDILPADQSLQEPLSREAPKIGIDAEIIGDNQRNYAIMATEATSLHTDRAVGQRFVLEGGVSVSNKSLGDYDLTTLDLQNTKQVMRFGHTHGVPVMGGSFILEVSSYIQPISDLGWGRSAGSDPSTNPYQTQDNDPRVTQSNSTDKNIKFLVRPVRVLDHKHVEMFRIAKDKYLSSTAAGRYGLFVYDTPNGRATQARSTYVKNNNPSPTGAPYPPAYLFDSSSDYIPISRGPKIPGSKSSAFVSQLEQPVARMIVSANTLQHYRGDASRKQSVKNSDEEFIRFDFNTQPRFTQSLYAGEKQNKTTHTGESNRSDNNLD